MKYFLLILLSIPLTTTVHGDESESKSNESESNIQVAIFAGGCFWCMEPPFDKMDGVLSTISGYTGGRTSNPTYEQVKTGRTGHIESLQVTFDSQVVTYEQLLWVFWHNVDPVRADGQFCDKGNQYRPMIFYQDAEQKRLAEKTRAEASEQLGMRLKTSLVKATTFYEAEEYHQDYYQKNPTKYKFYRWNCGRDKRLTELWGDKAGKP